MVDQRDRLALVPPGRRSPQLGFLEPGSLAGAFSVRDIDDPADKPDSSAMDLPLTTRALSEG
jgi:hypothetical protein